MSRIRSSSSDSSDCHPGSPLKQIKLSQQITKHPGRFVGSGTSLASIESCLINETQTPKQSRTTPAKRLSKFSPVRFMKVPPLQPKKNSSGVEAPAKRCTVVKNLFDSARKFDDDDDDDNLIFDPLLDEDWCEEFSYRVRNFTNLLMDVLGDSSTFHLIDSNELNVVSKFLNMPSHCKELYIQMFNRKHKWHQVSDIKYAPNMADMFNELESYGFVTSDIMSEDLDDLLDMLKVSDLKALCKEFSVKAGGTTKPEMKKALINYGRSQKTLLGTDSASIIKSKIPKLVGHSIKLCDDARKLFHRISVLFSVPFSSDDNVESVVYQNTLHINYVENGKMIYPNYNIVKTMPLFASKEALMKYEEAVVMENELSGVIARKDMDVLKIFTDETWVRFRSIVQDELQCKEVMKLPPFLRCFTAGSVYARILFASVQKLKRDDGFLEDSVQILKELLQQNIYYPQHRGLWYDLLVSILRIKRPLAAARMVIQALKDPELDEIQRCTLSNRGSRLLAQKKPLPKKIRLNLYEVIDELPEEPAVNEIEAKSLQNNKQGFKLVYVQEDSTEGITYSSVEELVISRYKKLGYLRGMHAENKFIISLFGLVFWDVIYDHTVPDVFQSRYQFQPLDLKTKFFYFNRKDIVDARLSEMESWTVDDIRTLVTQRYNEHKDKLSIVYWNLFSNVRETIELIDCIGMHVLSLLCERMVKSYVTASSGFPDLVLWTPGQREKCKFVEVKGQGDSLSPNQKVWIDYLINIGADTEVCFVRRVGHKKTQKKASASTRTVKRKTV
ncbi:fanconi-associated nuclease 1 [Anabrus simplex]|uniref:fanconi-associated nuclease 1 n=1 Tax=Anabrus simplex TaxID=316456 RepID=UPI0035A263D1